MAEPTLTEEAEMCIWKNDAKTDVHRNTPKSTFNECQKCMGYNIQCSKHQHYQKSKK